MATKYETFVTFSIPLTQFYIFVKATSCVLTLFTGLIILRIAPFRNAIFPRIHIQTVPETASVRFKHFLTFL